MEQVLVIPAERLEVLGGATGFIRHDYETVQRVLNPIDMRFLDRTDELESNPAWKQLIPYMVLTYESQDDKVWVFAYTRSKMQGEQRLHGKRSIGIGGHINASDVADDGGARNPLSAGARRELNEEVRIFSAHFSGLMHLLYDPSNEVGEVHLGIVIRHYLDAPAALPNERAMANAGWVELSQLVEEKDQFENWSQLCIDELAKGNL